MVLMNYADFAPPPGVPVTNAPLLEERFAFFSCFGSEDLHHPPKEVSNLIRDETREESEGIFKSGWRKGGDYVSRNKSSTGQKN
jgi:hypothetical protein